MNGFYACHQSRCVVLHSTIASSRVRVDSNRFDFCNELLSTMVWWLPALSCHLGTIAVCSLRNFNDSKTKHIISCKIFFYAMLLDDMGTCIFPANRKCTVVLTGGSNINMHLQRVFELTRFRYTRACRSAPNTSTLARLTKQPAIDQFVRHDK